MTYGGRNSRNERRRGDGRGSSEKLATPEPRKSESVANRKSKGKAVVVYSKSSRKQREAEKPEHPQLDDVHRKKRKLMEASNAVVSKPKECLFFSFEFITHFPFFFLLFFFYSFIHHAFV